MDRITVDFEILFSNNINYYRSPTPPYVRSVLQEYLVSDTNVNLNQLDEWSRISFDIPFDEELILKTLFEEVCNRLQFESQILECDSLCQVQTETDMISLDNLDIKINKVFTDLGLQDVIHLRFVFSEYQGEIWRENNIRYYMHSREQGSHNLPHVHVLVGHEYEASVDILSVEVLEGYLPSKQKRIIINKIRSNHKYLLDCWNARTDGLFYDLNYGLEKR